MEATCPFNFFIDGRPQSRRRGRQRTVINKPAPAGRTAVGIDAAKQIIFANAANFDVVIRGKGRVEAVFNKPFGRVLVAFRARVMYSMCLAGGRKARIEIHQRAVPEIMVAADLDDGASSAGSRHFEKRLWR